MPPASSNGADDLIEETGLASLAKRLARHGDSSPAEFLDPPWEAAPSARRERGDIIYREGADEEHFYVLEEGWAIGWVALRHSRRFIHRIYQRGDLVGLEDINWSYATTTAEALTDIRTSRIHKAELNEAIRKHAHFGTALLGMAMLDQVVAMDRARSNSRSYGARRLAHLLLQIEARSAVTDDLENGCFLFPLAQYEIADALGLTPIHTNRSMQQLLQGGLISRDKKLYKIEDRKAMNDLAEFTNRYIVTRPNR
ncbi:helix-turn-helix domain-containing protein [Altererythrobacter aurantiacus]|uniref:Helix-turn-helix domain-containing protein n=1 Tax=Parapontixanthobacter aurantiacus TaxID=1463599 RepID=A0A844ZGS9_9SPHN|nr:Crp/Fnr family transcriptional regulator [Parapontixanthobacter aurantiacus]MXO86978.1 helix-turn-helix domain-containing protein [Parapontixanthobacter aurantiacus]